MILKHIDELLGPMNISFTNIAKCILLKKAKYLFSESRLLDGFLDLCDTITSLATIDGIKKIDTSYLKHINFIWELFYDKNQR